MFDRPLVLVAIDHATNNVERTIDVARSAAKARGADVHVLQGSSEATPGPMLSSSAHDGVRVRRVALRGTPEHAIPAYAQLHRAAMLVVEAGYGSSRFWRNGRVVEELARRSPIPVLVLPKKQTGGRRELRRILTAVDSSIASAVALRATVDLARRHGARVSLVHALEGVPRRTVFSGGEAWQVLQRLPAELETVSRRLRRQAALFGANEVDAEVATGFADNAILEIAARNGADLVVMGIAHRSWFDRLLNGSTLRRVLRRAAVPVLVVPVVAGDHLWPGESAFDESGRWAGFPAESAKPLLWLPTLVGSLHARITSA